MATNRRDVNLVVRARDEATKAFESVADALNDLLGVNNKVGASANRTSQDLAALTAAALSFDKTFSKIAEASNRAGAAFERSQTNIDGQRQALAALKAQAESSTRAIEALQVAFVDRGLSGGTDFSDLIALLRAAETESRRLDTEIAKLTNSIATNEAALEGQRSALQQVASTANAAEAAQRDLRGVIDDTTRAQREQKQAAEVLANVERSTGVSRDRTETDAIIAQLQAEGEAHDRKIAKLKVEQAETVELAQIQEAQRRAAKLLPGDTTTGKSARESAAIFQQADIAAAEAFEKQLRDNRDAAQQMEAAASGLRAQLNPMAEIQSRLNKELAEADRLFKAGRISATELAQAEALLKANADKAAQALGRQGAGSGKPTLFGLKPFEIQNLGFQINDVVTQLASGTSLTQTLAQQGGQILQIFPKVGNALVMALKNPVVLGFAAGVAGIVTVLREASQQSAVLREFQGVQDATGVASGAMAEDLRDAANAFDHMGLSAQQAVALVRTFINEGINPERLVAFGDAATDMATVLGVDVKQAGKDLADAFTGGYQAIRKLDDATKFLTFTEREHIKQLFEEGRAQEARAEAFRIFEQRYDGAAAKMRGPWTQAIQSMGNAWDSFVKLLASTEIIQSTAGALDDLARSATAMFNKLSGARTLADIDHELSIVTRRIKELQDQEDKFGKQPAIDALLESRLERWRELNQERAAFVAANESSADTASFSADEVAKAKEDFQDLNASQIAADKSRTASERIAAAERTAGLEFDRKVSDERFKALDEGYRIEQRNLAIANARREVEEKITKEKEEQARRDEQTIRSFSAKVPGVESSGNNNARPKNKDGSLASSALGQGQFIESTWLALFRKHFPDEAAKLGKEGILELRRDASITKRMIELYARENAEVLRKAGLAVTEANLYLSHFLGPQTAKNLIKAADKTPVASVVGQGAVAANPSVLGGGKTVGDVKAFANKKFGGSEASRADADVTTRLAEIEQDRLETQDKFSKKIELESEERRQQIDALNAQKGLTDTALIAKEREQFVNDEILKKTQEIEKLNADRARNGLPGVIAFTEEERKKVTELAGAYFDAAHAKDLFNAQRAEVERPVQDLQAQRDAILQQIELAQQLGDQDLLAGLEASLTNVNGQLDTALATLIAFYEALATNPEQLAALGLTAQAVQAIVTNLQAAQMQLPQLRTQFIATGRDINQMIAGRAAAAFDQFAQSVAQGKNVLKSLGQAFLQFAADFLREIAQMIIKQIIFNAISGGTSSGGGGAGGFLSGLMKGAVKHSGGVVGGTENRSRAVDSGWFANARRMHTGGIAGLKPNEVPAILKKNEEVITENDPRHAFNQKRGGAGGSKPQDISNILVFEPETIAQVIASQAGRQVVVSILRENIPSIRQELAAS